MKRNFFVILSILVLSMSLQAQTLQEAKTWYRQKKYEEAKPIFKNELQAKPTDASLNLWYGVCLYETGGNIDSVEQYLQFAATRNLPNAYLYLGDIYTTKYRFQKAIDQYDQYAKLNRRDKSAVALAEERKAKVEGYLSLVRRSEDIQIIDSVVVDKKKFLDAYKLTPSAGKVLTFNEMFGTKQKIDATAYQNEKGTRVFYSQKDKDGVFRIYSMEKLLDQFGDEKQVSPTNFGLQGDENYPFVQTDGVTFYFAAKDSGSIGGYDLFVTRYNLNDNTFLRPDRLNMPFNSTYNDYMMVIDDEKDIGWFASDRFQPEGKVCVYTFIPNEQVKTLDDLDGDSLAMRARIFSIKDTWKTGVDYSKLIALARKDVKESVVKKADFTFVINDNSVYHKLSDFKKSNARAAFSQLAELNRTLLQKEQLLEEKRLKYTQSGESVKKQMTTEILSLEKEVELLKEQQRSRTIQVRNLENN